MKFLDFVSTSNILQAVQERGLSLLSGYIRGSWSRDASYNLPSVLLYCSAEKVSHRERSNHAAHTRRLTFSH